MNLPVPTLLLLASGLTAQATLPTQLKLLYNEKKTTSALRATRGTDTIFYMVDPDFHSGSGRVGKMTLVLQDQDGGTMETLKLGFVKPSSTNPSLPDISPSGLIGEATFTGLFGTGKPGVPQAFVWTMIFASPTKVPDGFGLRAVLPKPTMVGNYAVDGLFLHHQSGASVKLPSSVAKKQWTFALDSLGRLAALDAPAATLFWGPQLDAPVSQVFVNSRAYNPFLPAENLFGPESLFPAPSRGDRLGWFLEAKNLAVTGSRSPGLAIVLAATRALPTLVVTGFGNLYLDPTAMLQIPLGLDNRGLGRLGPWPLPAKWTLHSQALFLDLNPGAPKLLQLSGYQKIRVQ